MPLEHKTRPALVALVQDLKRKSWEADAPIWRDVAKRLEKPTKHRIGVNVSRVERVLGDNEVALVPGKLLATGTVTRPLKVAAFAFSQSAKSKVEAAGGRCLTITQLALENPSGKNVRIVG